MKTNTIHTTNHINSQLPFNYSVHDMSVTFLFIAMLIAITIDGLVSSK